MKSQKKLWENEHINKKIFTRIYSDQPSGPVVDFVNFLMEQKYISSKTKILDIGCGAGRNSIYLAKQSFRVTGTDFAENVIKKLNSQKTGAKFNVVDMSGKWPYQNSGFDAVIDCNCTICIPNPGRENAIKEVERVLKPKGYYLFYGIGPKGMLGTLPGPEPNSGMSPDGKFEKQYTKKELIQTYHNFNLIDLKTQKGKDVFIGKETEYLMWVGLFQKK